jgi:hypothetical protein
MRLFLTLLLAPTFAFATKIPVEIFDQSKLETLLRNNPSAFDRIETRAGFIRKHYQFPKDKKSGFTINCEADYYGEAKIPSYKSCEIDVSSEDFVGDEYLIKITDAEIVKSLRDSISYGSDLKKFIAFERVYGQAHDGVYRNLFRYTFICKRDACDVTFTTKSPEP